MMMDMFFHRVQEEYDAMADEKVFTIWGTFKGEGFKEEIRVRDSYEIDKRAILKAAGTLVEKKYWERITKHDAVCP